MAECEKGFVRFDLALTREQHETNNIERVYKFQPPQGKPVLYIRREDVPNYRHLRLLLERVGKPYGWDRRAEYHDPANVKKLDEILRRPDSKRWTFWADDKIVGGTIIANVETEKDLAKIFRLAKSQGNKQIEPSMASKSVEIYKIGLFPEYTNNGWGGYFLTQVLTALFIGDSRPDVVYLNTRDTNHRGVISFYRQFNMKVIHAQDYEDDLIPERTRQSKASILGKAANTGNPAPTKQVA